MSPDGGTATPVMHAIVPPDAIRSGFARAGEPKRLLEIEGGHYSVYVGPGADEAARAATEWFTEHLLHGRPAGTAPA
jgi:poly(3-hydroxyalkanoate) synthetase